MTAKVNIRSARPSRSDTSGFCNLFNRLYARKVNDAYYRWRFFSPALPTILRLAESADGELIGCYGAHCIRFSTSQVQGVLSVDIMVVPEYQRQGVFRTLVADVEQQTTEMWKPSFLYVMANERAYHAHARAAGWSLITTLKTFVRPTNESSLLNKMAGPDTVFSPIEQFGPEVSSISRKFNGLYPQLLTVDRNETYLNWRFVENPWYDYAPFLVTRHDEPFGYLVLKVFRDPVTGESFGDIVDIVWQEEDVNALVDMVEFALAYFRQQGVKVATIWLQTNTILDQVGRYLGFKETKQVRYLCGRVLNDRWNWILDPQKWFVTLADSEIY